ncbi:MAG: ThiF family adenylyltransferase [Gammaproteobacteria bacterium]|nr:ThiF family adenylyltransferase [Gammaproteobacteria bacterium]MDE2347790.1 ThiF family adenylyltransferase [Gammaproteobacteria bacterium]
MHPDYSRQISLREVGPAGQARLAAGRVLVVGAGGLGSPVLQYLAGAGVGCLGIVDDDLLDSSNLHRQPLYALADVGRPKARLAADALEKINPQVRTEVHGERFTAENAAALVAAYDVVVDCSDNFRTKFLVNDAAVLAGVPAVFASIYQYEGQIQVYKPQADHACLRCLWPDATADGIVGNCAEAGVLGPVAGSVGAMQATLALQILLDIGGQLRGELMLIDFMRFSTLSLKAPRRPACRAPHCAMIRKLEDEERDLEVRLESFDEAIARDWVIVDIRSDAEAAAAPAPGRRIGMADLLADPALLPVSGQYLLICATGKRSFAAARTLRRAGYSVRSLAGGLRGMQGPH